MAKQKRHVIPAKKAVLQVVGRLRQEGYQALLAGGCVRDMLLGKVPYDYDVATNAVPESVVGLFGRTLTIGAQFGVVMVLIGGRKIEVATFRSDEDYRDGRHPEKVVFTDARHDAQRRDFTINGMFFDTEADEVIDYVGGREDLKKGIVRAIGDPDKRFGEDHLRMLRAIRFAARLGFEIEGDTWRAICKYAEKIEHISAERIADELEKIVVDPNRAEGLGMARDSGLLGRIFGDIEEGKLGVGVKVVGTLPGRCSFALGLAGLLVECGEREVGRVCRDLKSSNELRKQLSWLVGHRGKLLDEIPMTKGRLKKWLAEPLFEPLVALTRSWLRAGGHSDGKLRQLRQQINELGDEAIAPVRLLDGHELIQLGAEPGPMVGQLAEELYLAQLENEVRTKSGAGKWVKHWLVRHDRK